MHSAPLQLKTSHLGSFVVAACFWWHRQFPLHILSTILNTLTRYEEFCTPAAAAGNYSPTGQLFDNTLQEPMQVRKGKTDAHATHGGDLSSRRAAWHESRTDCETARASSSNTEEDRTIRSSLMTHQDLDGTHHPALLPIVTAETTGCNLRQQLGSASKIRREGKTMCGL